MTSPEQKEDWKEEFWYKVAEWNTASPEDIDIYANQLEMLVEYHIREAVNTRTQEVVEIAESRKATISPIDDAHTFYNKQSWNAAINDIISSLSPEVKDDSK